MKKTKPSLKESRRYLLINSENKERIEEAIDEYLGVRGMQKANPIFFEDKKGIILSINSKELYHVLAAFEIYKEKIDVLKVSGTIKGIKK